jgi:hypothetical protein
MKKYIFILLMMGISLHAMEKRALKVLHEALTQTQEYKHYVQTKKEYEENRNADTYAIMQQAGSKAAHTPEFKKFCKTSEEQALKNTSKSSFSENVLKKHEILKQTEAYKLYQQAKYNHEHFNNKNSLQTFQFCKKELFNTQEYKDWEEAVDKEPEVVARIFQSQKESHEITIEIPKPCVKGSECWISPPQPQKTINPKTIIFIPSFPKY